MSRRVSLMVLGLTSAANSEYQALAAGLLGMAALEMR
jgi:hypothetical protein